MTFARQEIAPEGVEGVYHCVSRCVRMAFLCGAEPHTGRSFDHRQEWVQSRLQSLAAQFGVEVCAYVVRPDHFHVILRTRPDLAESWSDEETARRWLQISPKKMQESSPESTPDKDRIRRLIRNKRNLWELRQRLGSMSWFMRYLNEFIARRANQEDGCRGRFWEGRFKCQTLLDEPAILTCMAYVDLLSDREGRVDSPQNGEFTSIHERIRAHRARMKLEKALSGGAGEFNDGKRRKQLEEQAALDRWLCPIGNGGADSDRGLLPMGLDEYLDLVDCTGRLIEAERPGPIPEHLLPILAGLKVDPDHWVDTVSDFGELFWRVAGRNDSIRKAARRAGRRWLRGSPLVRWPLTPIRRSRCVRAQSCVGCGR